jgi:hypothetical protein
MVPMDHWRKLLHPCRRLFLVVRPDPSDPSAHWAPTRQPVRSAPTRQPVHWDRSNTVPTVPMVLMDPQVPGGHWDRLGFRVPLGGRWDHWGLTDPAQSVPMGRKVPGALVGRLGLLLGHWVPMVRVVRKDHWGLM